MKQLDRLELGDHPELVRWGRRLLLTVLALGATVLGFWLLMQWVGIVNAIIYSLLFVVGLALLPFLIALLGADLPWNGMFGRLHILLGALAFNHHYLVDLGDRWEWCPGEAERVYIDGKWYAIEGGFENRSVLGWRPFGILRFKDEDTLTKIRADTAAERQRGGEATAPDGGSSVTQGGYSEKSPPAVTGVDGEWLIDLKRLFASGVPKIGAIDLVETAEEVIERGEVSPGTFDEWRPVIGVFAGILLGVIVGWMTFMA